MRQPADWGGQHVVDSNNTGSIDTTGSGSVSDSLGGVYVSGPGPASQYGNISPVPVTGQPPTPDPLRFMPKPSQPAAAPAPSSTSGKNATTTYYPGYYASGLSLSGTAVLSPGIYYINGNFSTNTGTVTGNGVMIFIDANGSLSLAGNGSVTLVPSTYFWRRFLAKSVQ